MHFWIFFFLHSNPDKKTVKGTIKWNDEGQLVTTLAVDNGKKMHTVTRYIDSNGEMILKVKNQKDKQMTRYFKKTDEKSGL